MKNLLLTLAIAFSSAAFGQGNLQFNQVINLDYTASFVGFSKQNLGSVTVPAGKVWKIESATMYRDAGTYNYSLIAEANLTFGNVLIKDSKNSSNINNTAYPIWLASGTYPITMSQNNASASTYVCAVSIIEFNVVP